MAIINYIPNVKTPTGFDTLNTVSQFTNHVATGVFTNVDTYEINVPAPNDILTGQFVIIFVPDTDSIVGMKISINNGTAIPIDGVGVGSLQTGVATSLLVDVGAGVAYQYFKDVDLTANNLPLTTGTANLYGLSGVDANVDDAFSELVNTILPRDFYKNNGVSTNANGYMILGNLILEWMYYPSASSGGVIGVTLPITIPANGSVLYVGSSTMGTDSGTAYVSSFTKSAVTIAKVSKNAFIFVIGWLGV